MANFPAPNRMNRRGFLTVGTIGLGGLTLADVLRLQSRADQKSYAAIAAKADSVIHIFLPGGIAHQETFDPKPFAPIEYRGYMGSIPTKIEGERFSYIADMAKCDYSIERTAAKTGARTLLCVPLRREGQQW